jgi:hypothetical protein
MKGRKEKCKWKAEGRKIENILSKRKRKSNYES